MLKISSPAIRRLAMMFFSSLMFGIGCGATCAAPVCHELAYAPAPVDNPLKGLVPYAGDVRERFPHSMEFSYLPLSALVIGPEAYDWQPLEKLLNEVAARGHQTVFRVYLEYPGRTNSIPAFLIQGGLKVHSYWNSNSGTGQSREILTPDYADPNLRRTLQAFIRALGRRYDGDPRIGFITAGLLGSWGEWHDHPRSDLFASAAVQTEIMDAYEAAFHRTHVLLRYPAGAADAAHAANAQRPFGYHDDSFAWGTLATGRQADAWYYLARLQSAGPDALTKWRREPIGGEIRPEAWGKVFDAVPDDPKIQNFLQCVEATHVTWLMDSGMFRNNQPTGRRQRAEAQVRRMGYEFQVQTVTFDLRPDRQLSLSVTWTNRGVAPFYYDWPLEYGLLNPEGKLVKTFPSADKLTGLLPGEPARVWRDALNLAGVPGGNYRVLLRVPNPLPNGKALRFANETQDQDLPDWLTLGNISISDTR